MTFSKKLPRVSNGFGILVWRDQLGAQPHNCRSNSEKKTSHNIEQHLYSFDINWDSTQDPKESIHSICDVNVSTAPPTYPNEATYLFNRTFRRIYFYFLSTYRYYILSTLLYLICELNYKS
jgi:hypothetical protein